MAFDSDLYFTYINNDLLRNAYAMTNSKLMRPGAYDFFTQANSRFQHFLTVIYARFDAEIAEAKRRIKSKDFGYKELATATRTFARWAAVKTPPNAGSATPYSSQKDFEKLYYRPILFLPSLVQGKIQGFIATQQDKDALREKFLYKIVDTREGKKKAYCYTKTKSEALEQARIANRGLNKAAWGINIHQIGVKEIKEIRNLLKESPNIVENAGAVNLIFFNQQENSVKKFVELHNRATGVNASYKNIIARSAMRYADRYLKHAIEAETKNVLKDVFLVYRNKLAEAEQSGLLKSMHNVHQMLTGEDVAPQTLFNQYMSANQSDSFFDSYNATFEKKFGSDVNNRFFLDFNNSRVTFSLR